jgi:hypothetical protein
MCLLWSTNWAFISQKTAFFIVSHENLKSYIALTGWTLYRRCIVSPVKYELGLYIPEDGILHSHCRENLKSYNVFCLFTRTVLFPMYSVLSDISSVLLCILRHKFPIYNCYKPIHNKWASKLWRQGDASTQSIAENLALSRRWVWGLSSESPSSLVLSIIRNSNY